MSARKIGFLILLLGFGAVVETAWGVRQSRFSIGPEGCRVLSGRFHGPSFTFEASKEHALPTEETSEIEVTNEFGAVRVVVGEPSTVRVKLRKVVYLPTEEKARTFAERIDLTLEEEEGHLRVGTNRGELGRDEEVGFETHLELEAPPEIRLQVRSDHGPVTVVGVAAAEVKASHDEVRVEKVKGPVTIDVQHAGAEASEIAGELKITARHGDVKVSDVSGPVGLDVRYGNVSIERTGAVEARLSRGELAAHTVSGDLVVKAQRAEVTAADVAGRAEVETTFNDIRLTGVGGDVAAKTDHGEVRAEDVEGAVTARATFDGVHLAGIKGAVEVTVERGGVEARSVEKGARIRARGDDVSIDGFRGPIDIVIERGRVELTPGAPISERIEVSSRQGAIRLEVPPDSRFALTAESRHGEVQLDVPGLEAELSRSGPGTRATGTMGGGEVSVKLTADDDVTLAAAPSLPAERPVTE